MTIKKNTSLLKDINNLQKKIDSCDRKRFPTFKEVMRYRTEQLVCKFFSHNSDINKPKISLKEFCIKENISESTLRTAIKNKTGKTLRDVNVNSNNIKLYNDKKKYIINKVLVEGLDSLSNNEKETYKNLQETALNRQNLAKNTIDTVNTVRYSDEKGSTTDKISSLTGKKNKQRTVAGNNGDTYTAQEEIEFLKRNEIDDS